MTGKAAELRAAGVDVVNLSVGEPDFPTPANIQEAGIKAIRENRTKYTAAEGLLELRQAACTKLARDNSLQFDPSQILISNGGKLALFVLFQTLFQEGDEVIIFNPYWVSYPDLILMSGADYVLVETDPASQFEPVFEDLIRKISPRTKGLILNSPTNPTGGVWSDEAIKHVVEIALQHDLWVISDECYEQFIYDSQFKSTAALTDNQDRIITLHSCSKTYAMTGWRIGYTAALPEIITAMKKYQGHAASSPNAIGQYAAIEALAGDQSFIPDMRKIFHKRRNLMVDELNRIPEINCPMPGGAFYVFPDFSHYMGKHYNGREIKNSGDLSMYFLEEAGVVTVSGMSFGSPTHIRFSYTASEEDIEKGIKRIGQAIQKLM